jgi:hypothetical protein
MKQFFKITLLQSRHPMSTLPRPVRQIFPRGNGRIVAGVDEFGGCEFAEPGGLGRHQKQQQGRASLKPSEGMHPF